MVGCDSRLPLALVDAIRAHQCVAWGVVVVLLLCCASLNAAAYRLVGSSKSKSKAAAAAAAAECEKLILIGTFIQNEDSECENIGFSLGIH